MVGSASPVSSATAQSSRSCARAAAAASCHGYTTVRSSTSHASPWRRYASPVLGLVGS
jgi:hypothetical protein